MLILSRNIARNINTCLNSHLSFRTDGVRTSQKCVCIYTAVYSQTRTARSIYKCYNISCIIPVHKVLFGASGMYMLTPLCSRSARANVLGSRDTIPRPGRGHLMLSHERGHARVAGYWVPPRRLRCVQARTPGTRVRPRPRPYHSIAGFFRYPLAAGRHDVIDPSRFYPK